YANGAGIYARGSKGYFGLAQTGYGKEAAPTFQDCKWGIYTEYMHVQSSKNRMLNMGTAYRIDRSGLRHVDVLRNQVHTYYNGIDLRANDGASHILVEDNDITFGDCPGVCKAHSGIY